MKKFFLILGIIASVLGVIASTTAILNNSNHHICDFSEKVSNKLATCTSSGVDFYYCDCGKFLTEEVPPLKHNFVADVCVNCSVEAVTARCYLDTCYDSKGNYISKNYYIQVAENTFWNELDGCIINNRGYVVFEIVDGLFGFLKDGSSFVKDGPIGNKNYTVSYYGETGYMDLDPSAATEFWLTYHNSSGSVVSGFPFLSGAQVYINHSLVSSLGSSFVHWTDQSGNVYENGAKLIIARDTSLTAVKQ